MPEEEKVDKTEEDEIEVIEDSEEDEESNSKEVAVKISLTVNSEYRLRDIKADLITAINALDDVISIEDIDVDEA